MPDQYYPIIPIEIQPGEMEGRGTRRKLWVVRKDSQTEWLLKFPRPGTGEHWAEKLAAEIGRLININTAHVELARSGVDLATICRSFLSDLDDSYYDIDPEIMWFHGSEFLGLVNPGYDVNRVWLNRAHNLKNIIAAIVEIAAVGSTNPMAGWDTMMEGLASYALLDGLVGNTDRHHENWMVAYVENAGDIRMHVSPSFDHASSLGRELVDEHRERILSSNDVLNYLKRGHGGVFVDGAHARAPSPLRLAQLLCRWQPRLARTWFDRLNSVSDTEFRSVIDRIPPEFMSDIAKDFAFQVVVTSKVEMLRSIR